MISDLARPFFWRGGGVRRESVFVFVCRLLWVEGFPVFCLGAQLQCSGNPGSQVQWSLLGTYTNCTARCLR